MSLPLPRLVLVLVMAAVAAGGAVFASQQRARGSEQAQQAVDRAFAGNGGPRSGRFMGALDVQIEGAPSSQLSTPVTMSMRGAFKRAAKGSTEKAAADMSMNVAGQAVQVGFVTTGSDAFLRIGGNYYAVPSRQFAANLSPAAGLSSLGVDPRSWLEDVKSEGTALIGGVQSDHVSASVDTDKVVDDLAELATKSGAPAVSKISSKDMDQLKGVLHDARLDLYTGKSDGILRKLSLQGKIEANGNSGTMDFNMEFTDINKPQRITAPLTSRPLSQLESDLRSGGLSALGGLASGGLQSGGTGNSSGSSASGGGDSSAISQASQAYLKCISKASTPQALQSCSGLLP